MKKHTVNETIFVDFKQKKVVKSVTKKFKISPDKKQSKSQPVFNFSDFQEIPVGSNFEWFSPADRMEYFLDVANNIKDVSFEDLVHWANNGMLDMKKMNEVLDIDYPTRKPKKGS